MLISLLLWRKLWLFFPGIRFARECGLVPIVVESDSQSIIKLIINRVVPQVEVGVIILDILHSEFLSSVISFNFNPRTANKVANALAKAVVSLASDLYWIETYPPIVVQLIYGDFPE
ncbi:hypothetical protein ACOSP7_020427 [Xanthoceras sorbifolium]